MGHSLNSLSRYGHYRLLLPLLLLSQVFADKPAHAQPAVYHFVPISGRISSGSADGTNGNARFWQPAGMAADTNGNLFVTDSRNNTVRELIPASTNWVARTLAGLAGSPGAVDGTNADARFNFPLGIALDHNGNLFVADVQTATIRMLTPLGTNWAVRTIAGLAGATGAIDGTNQDIRFTAPTSLAVDPDGNLIIADYRHLRQLTRFGNDWVSSTLTLTNFSVEYVNWVSLDDTGTLYVTGSYDVGNDAPHSVFARLTPSGTNWAGGVLPLPPFGYRDPFQITAGPNNTAFVSTWHYQVVWELAWTGSNWAWSSVAGTPSVTGSADGTNSGALFDGPAGMAVGSDGNLFVCDDDNNTVRRITRLGADWVTTTIAGLPPNSTSADGTNDLALFSQPYGLAVDSAGNVYTADTGAHAVRLTRKVGQDWVTRTLAGSLGQPGSADGTNSDARLNSPAGLAVSPTGVLYVVDRGNNTIRKVEQFGTNWITTTIAGLPGSTNWQDGTNSDIRLQGPWGIALDASGSLYITEGLHRSLRKLVQVGTNWVSTTLASDAGPIVIPSPNAVNVGPDGTVYFTDEFADLDALQPAGTNWVFSITSYAGIFGSIALDNNGNFFFTDPEYDLVQELARVGTDWAPRSLVGGLEPIDYSGSTALLQAIALGPHGDLYVADGNVLWLGVRQPVVAAAPVLQNLVLSNGVATCTWPSVAGLAYQLQYCTNLSSQQWLNVGNPLTATSASLNAIDPAVSDQQRFYRVVLLP